MERRVRFEIQEREDLQHLSVEGVVEYGTGVQRIVSVDDHDKFTKLVLTCFMSYENSFDCIFLDGNPKMPKLARIWPHHLFPYFDVPDIEGGI